MLFFEDVCLNREISKFLPRSSCGSVKTGTGVFRSICYEAHYLEDISWMSRKTSDRTTDNRRSTKPSS